MPTILSVSDTPENVEKILAAIREIDVKPADVLFTVQLVLGSESDAATDAELQNDPIIKELRKLLRYKGYTLLDSSSCPGCQPGTGVGRPGPEGRIRVRAQARRRRGLEGSDHQDRGPTATDHTATRRLESKEGTAQTSPQ